MQYLLNISLSVEKEELRELIKKIINGEWHLYLPQFQRRFEWEEEDIRFFFDSVIRNLPVGSIILWKPARKIEDDPFAVPLIDLDKVDQKGESYYLLDGQQRLTSLLLLYCGWKIFRHGEPIPDRRISISYVPAQNKLIIGERGGIDLSKLFKEYLDGKFDKVVENYPSYREVLEKITRRIIEYKVPIYIIKTFTEDSKVMAEMADAFIRINKAGVRIGTVELMLSFLAGTISGEFGREIRRIHKDLEGYDLDLNILIRFILSNFGVKQTAFSDVDHFKSKIEEVKFEEETLKSSKSAIKLVMDFLNNELGLSTCKIIPSKVSIVPIAKYFYEQHFSTLDNISNDERKDIVNWFIIVNMKGYYSSSTNSRLQTDLETIQKSHGKFPYNDLLNNLSEKIKAYKIKRADIERGNTVDVLRKQGLHYLFLLYILLAKEKIEDLDGSLLTAKPYSNLHRHHIFPREIFEEYYDDIAPPDDPDEKEIYINGLGNVTFVSGPLHEEIPKKLPEAEPINYLPRFPTLLKHFIPQEKELWKLKNFEEFKQKRIDEIYNAAKKHFMDIVE